MFFFHRTNLPKEVMQYLDHPYPKEIEKSYLKQPEVLEYIQDYSKRFNLEKAIKVSTHSDQNCSINFPSFNLSFTIK